MKTNIASNTLGQFLFLILLIFTFITYPGSNIASEDPVVWYYNGLPIFFATAVSVIYFAKIILTHSIRFDKVGFWLCCRIFICLVPLLYISIISSFSAHYPVVLFSFIAYCIGRSNLWKYEHQTGLIIVFFGAILCLQVFFTFQSIPTPYLSLDYKRYMRIPIAASNVIAAYIVPIFFLLLINYKFKRILKISLLCFFIVGIILTKSRGGVLVLVGTYLIYLIFFKFKAKLAYTLPILIIFGIGVDLIMEIPEVKVFLMGFSAGKGPIDINSLSSNRIEIYHEEFERFLSHPLFGNGMVFNATTSKAGAHNIVVELLVQSGILGTIAYLYPIFIVIKNSANKLSKNEIGWLLFIIAILLHGMIEVNFFNYSTDILFWSICGMLMNKYNNEK